MSNNLDNHIVILRTNQIASPSSISREQMYEGNPSWLSIRLDWLEKYLLTNFTTQTDPNFWCFMLSDPETPEPYKSRLENYEKLGFIKIIKTNEHENIGNSNFNDLILDTYKKVRKNNVEEVYCSRLDTDDMVGPEWNKIVKQLLKNHNRISLETVLLYNFLNKETRIINWEKGSFVSTKSTLDNFDNPRSFQHSHSGATQIHTDYPLTCMGIHDNNITNHNWWPAGRPYPLDKEIFNQMFKTKE